MTATVRARLDRLQEAARMLPDAKARFADGGEYRIEIPSVEGPEAFAAVMTRADELGVPVHRVSEGSGIGLLRDDDLRGYVEIGSARNVEVCLFVGPRAPWNASASSLAPDGKQVGWRHVTVATLRAAYDDILRAVELGIRSVLVADEGLAVLAADAKASGELPADLIVKASAVMGLANPPGVGLLAAIGVDTLNVAGDTPLAELAAFRAELVAIIDIYVESPDGLGGFLRYHDIGEIVRIAAPVHLKFGLRNAPNIYPSGAHLEAATRTSGIERVRRAAIGLEHLARQRPGAVPSPSGQPHRGVPIGAGSHDLGGRNGDSATRPRTGPPGAETVGAASAGERSGAHD